MEGPREINCLVNDQNCLAEGYYLLNLDAPDLARSACPGQFAMLKCGDGYDPFLRRPLSIHQVDEKRGEVLFLYQVRGKGTELLARREKGDRVSLLGPLGHGFSCSEKSKKGLLVGAGIGIAPLLFLASALAGRRWELVVLMGARTKDGILCSEEFERYAGVLAATEDGSLGLKGTILDLLKQELQKSSFHKIFACGPAPVLKGVQEISVDSGIPAELSLEERMACGVGACLGCTCQGAKGDYLRVCQEGPVFAAGEVVIDG